VEGKANAEVIAFLARAFAVNKAAVVIEAGQSARDKRVRISSPAAIPAELQIVK
jgi:uncharacterized protein YggU (UPF0235/DUF167 family)